MENLRRVLEESINGELFQMILSNPRNKEGAVKAKVRPMMHRGGLMFQVSSFVGSQVLHENFAGGELCDYLCSLMEERFRQLEIETKNFGITALISKKGRVTIKKKKSDRECGKEIDLSHNRVKKYILEEGKAVDFLVDLGVQTLEGVIVKSRYDKFKQINRFLEFIEDILPTLQKEGMITILDFGCGKSYLTFAMYYYLKELQHMDIRIIGLDLKKDVITECSRLKDKYGYEGLTFLQGDIVDYRGVDQVDMVVTLHACDTATDYALQKAVSWNARVILSVPCCQHELNKQIKCAELEPVLKYGLIRERMSALITDAYRAEVLEMHGYETQILEFIDMEHTPKNILIRAVKRPGGQGPEKEADSDKADRLRKLRGFLGINPTLSRIL